MTASFLANARSPMGKCLAFLLLLSSLGCASIGIKDASLQLEITPQPLKRGAPALAKINAPMDAAEVIGTVLVFGSPELLFQKDEKEGLWYFYGIIPFSPWVKPGAYTVRVSAHFASEQPHYTEMKVELQ